MNPAKCKDNWPIVKVIPTQWGKAIFKLYSDDETALELDLINMDDKQEEIELIDAVKPYRPDLIQTLAQPESEFLGNTGAIMKVDLGKASRTLSVPMSICLDELAITILDAFDFDNDHLYQFSYKNIYGLTEKFVHSYGESEDEWSTSDYRVGDIPLFVGMEVNFLFDFGDNWQFSIIIESIDATVPQSDTSQVIKSQGEAPEQYPAYDF